MEFKVIDLIKYYVKNLMLALIVIGISLIAGYYYLDNVYEVEYVAKTTVMLGANEETTDIGFNQKVIKNYLELVKSKNVLEGIINKTGLDYSNGELKRMINASFAEDTEFITISVISNDKNDAAKLSYAVYEGLVAEVERIFKISNIHLVESDTEGYKLYSDKLLIIILIFISLLMSWGIVLINYLFFPNFILQEKINSFRKYLKNKIKEKKEIRNIKREKKKQELENKKKELVKEVEKKKQVVKKNESKSSKKTNVNDTKKRTTKKSNVIKTKKTVSKKGSKKNG